MKDMTCRERWPDAVNGDYNPKCCRFPKSCSVEEPISIQVWDGDMYRVPDMEPVYLGEPVPPFTNLKNYSMEMTFPLDPTQGTCGDVSPDDPSLTCIIPNDRGEAAHLLWGGHFGMDRGVPVGWRLRCKCDCHQDQAVASCNLCHVAHL